MSLLNSLNEIGFNPDPDTIAARLRLGEIGGAVDLSRLLEQAASIACPRAAWAVFEPVAGEENTVKFAGETLTSRILNVNLAGIEKAALFVATCGRELEQWSEGFDDPLERWVTDEICEEALRQANIALESALDGVIRGEYRVSMNPGSLEDWPLTEQGPLFRALESAGSVGEATGVELTESFLMRPRKSLSGIRFASEEPFANCMLCPRDNCKGRRMRYDPAMFERHYTGAKQGSLYAGSCGCGYDPAR